MRDAGTQTKNLPPRVEQDILYLARKYGVRRVILFGSRARGDNRERSDIDLAVSGGDVGEFADAVEEEAWTLLLFDVVNLDRGVSPALQAEIDRDGVVLYDEV